MSIIKELFDLCLATPFTLCSWCVGETEGHVNSVSLSLIECRSRHTPYNVVFWAQLSACCVAMFSRLNRGQSHDVSNLLDNF